jgi:hypothetical protein
MAIFDSVPRESYDLLKGQLEVAIADRQAAEARYAALVDQMVQMKRHEYSMMPAGFDPNQADPWNSIGPKTQLAVEEVSAGDPELEQHNRAQALLAWKQYADLSPEERDQKVAREIRDGDT